MTRKEITERWLENSQAVALEKIQKLLLRGGELSHKLSPFGFCENKSDFRGLLVDKLTLKNNKLENIDFSFSDFERTWIEKSLFKQCVFISVNFSEFSDHGNKFKECTFINCKFSGAAIGYDGSLFESCIFEKSNFTRTLFSRPEFVNCLFKLCRLKNIDFNASYFEDCNFEGALADIWFRGGFPSVSDIEYFGTPKKNKMKNVSFENAELNDLTFSDDCDLSTVKIRNTNCYKYDNWDERLQFLKSKINNWDNQNEKKEAERFVWVYSVHSKNQKWYIINVDDIIRMFGKQVAVKIVGILNDWHLCSP